MTKEPIKNIEGLIQKYTGPSKQVLNNKVTKLTDLGENYLGIVLKVEATLKHTNNEEETFSAVAQCIDFKVMDFSLGTVHIQFKKERAFYTEILAVLQNFQNETNVKEPAIKDLFPVLYTSRYSLNDDIDEPDKDAVLLFENLSDQGYSTADRINGFDVDGAQLILQDLALFHGLSIALKQKKPNEFQNINKHLYNTFAYNKSFTFPQPCPNYYYIWLEILEEYHEVQPYLGLLKKSLNEGYETIFIHRPKPKEIFVGIAHADLWINNTMQIFKNGKIVKNKFLDFQLYLNESVAIDILFFLCTSVRLPDLLEHYDKLVKFYYKSLFSILEKSGCDTTLFTFENLMIEFSNHRRDVLLHLMFLFIFIFGKKGEAAVDVTKTPLVVTKEVISIEARVRMAKIICYFGKHGWI